MKDKIPEGSLVWVNAFDIQSYGLLVSNRAGYHVKLAGDDHASYFDYKDVFPVPQYDVIVDRPDFEWERYGGMELGSVLFTFNVSVNSKLYNFFKSRLRRFPYSITILHD